MWRAWVLCGDQSRGSLKISVTLLISLASTFGSPNLRNIQSDPLHSNRHCDHCTQNTAHNIANQPGALGAFSSSNRSLSDSHFSHFPIDKYLGNHNHLDEGLVTAFFNLDRYPAKPDEYRRFRREIQGFGHKLNTGNKVLVMLVESGILYCLSGVSAK